MAQPRHIQRRLVQLGSRSHGMVTRSGLLAEGLSERKIDYRLERGGLWPLFASTYSVGVPAKSWRAIWLGATLASGPGSMLAGKAAAALWGLSDERPARIEVNRPVGRNRVERSSPKSGWDLELRIRVKASESARPVILHGIPVMPVPELLLELAATSSPAEMEAMVSAASQKKLLNGENVGRLLESGRGRPGIDLLRFQLRYWDPEMRQALSVLETKFIRICRQRGIETPKTNRFVCGLKVDFVWFDRKVVVEVDGYTWHGDRVAFERDHDRPAVLLRNGYLRLAFTWRQVVEEPDLVVATVIAALSSWGSLQEKIPVQL